MILGPPSAQQLAAAGSAGRATLDDMFRRAAARHPDAIALVDPPDHDAAIGGAPRRLTYAEADRMVSALAGRLRRMGLQTDQVVAVQMPNSIETVLTLLGILRAGLIAAPLPLLWGRADAIAALSQVGAKTLIASGSVGDVELSEQAMHIAADVFPIRYVCGFGSRLPDGVVSFDDLFTIDKPDPLHEVERAVNPAAHVAVITWDVTADGLVPVARTHFELLSAAIAVVLESRIEPDAKILSSLAMGSFAGLTATVLPWLVAGGTLSLHQSFDASVLARQCEQERCAYVVVPGPIATRLADADILAKRNGLKSVIAVWRSPERLAASPLWREPTINLIDIHVFGEAGLVVARRGANGMPAPIALGPVTVPRGAPGAVLAAELLRTDAGTLAIRGSMVPRFPYPPGAERGDLPFFQVGDDGHVDTGFPCRTDRDTKAMVVTGPPAGLVSVGGYRFALRDLQDLAAQIEPGSTLAALPDTLAGHRLAGNAADRDRVRGALDRRGVNPLILGAFRERRMAEQPAAEQPAAEQPNAA